MHSADFSQHFYNNRNLCFEAYADAEINNISIEILLNNENVKTDIYVDEDEKTYKIPLTQFLDNALLWKSVNEIKFLFWRKKIPKVENFIIKNLRIE